MFSKNVGKTDKIIRLLISLSFLLIALLSQNYWFLLGLIPIVPVFTGCCPVYSLFGFRTCPLKSKA
ncbi:MAG: DUF2892 domain-containing protein [Thermonemataceae bacterium]|nr:DUF2892 domain-containing protein [Thermonemataceae bacterium]